MKHKSKTNHPSAHKIHIHKVVQLHADRKGYQEGTTRGLYDRVRRLYGESFDENSMIDIIELKKTGYL